MAGRTISQRMDALEGMFTELMGALKAAPVSTPRKAEQASPFAVVADAPEGTKLTALRAYHRAHKTPGQYCAKCDKGFAYPSKTGACKACGEKL